MYRVQRHVALAVCLWLTAGSPGVAAQSATPGGVDAWLSQIEHDLGPDAEQQPLARALAGVRQNADDARDWALLGDLLMQRGRDTEDGAWFQRAGQVYRHALDLDAASADALAGLAWVHGVRHEFEESKQWAERALAVDPDHASAHGLLGDAALELGDDDLAGRHYQEMLDRRLDLGSYARAAQFVHRTGDVQRAFRLMRQAIEAGAPHAENVAWCRAQLAFMLWRNGMVAAAEATLAPALDRPSPHVDVLIAAATLRTARRDYREAIELLERAMRIAPHHDVLVDLAELYAHLEDEAGHRATVARIEALQANPVDGDPGPLQVARYYADHDLDLAEAVRLAEVAYERRPTRDAADTLAWALYKAGRVEDARRMILTALDTGRRDAEMLYHAGMIYAELGDRRRAQQYLYEALSVNPSFHVWHAQVAEEVLGSLAGL